MEGTEARTEQSHAAEAEQVIVKACDMCRKKKIRCEPTTEGCAQCTKYRTHCHFTPISAKKKPRRPAGFKYITRLEERLKKMEGILENSNKADRFKIGESSHDRHGQFGILHFGAPENMQTDHGPQRSRLASLERTDLANPSFVASLSPPSWSYGNDKTLGKIPFAHDSFLNPLNPSPSWKRTLALGPFSLPKFQELPTKPIALQLVKDTFRSFNSFFPLFNEQDFLQQFHTQYWASSPNNPGWWACINVVLSLAHLFRAMRTLEVEHENAQACGYIHNALAVISEISILHNNLPAVQALVGMAIILQGTPNPQPASVLVAAAVRLAQAMGLHRKTQDSTLTATEIEQRKRVFWIAYFLDRDISLRMGQPFAQDDDDMDAELPTGVISELPLCGDGLRTINFFNSRIGLAVIQGQIYKRLYSVQAALRPEAQKVTIAEELNSLLAMWRSSVPIDFEDDPLAPLEGPLTAEFTHMLVLRFTYINCLVMIDRHLQSPTKHNQADVASEVQDVYAISESLCVIESRKAIRLVQITPRGDYACVWILLHPLFAAVTVLLGNVLRQPVSMQTRADLQSVEPFLRLLEVLSADERVCSRSDEAKRMNQFCNQLNGRAREAVENVDMMLAFE